MLRIVSLFLVVAGALAACDSEKASDRDRAKPVAGISQEKIGIDGSSTVFPLSKAMAEAFRSVRPNVQFSINESGTGGGFKKFCSGDLDIAGASRPIKAAEGDQCKTNKVQYIEVPIAFDSLSVVVNAKNTFVECLTVKELKAMWEPAAQGKITTWQQIRSSFPAQPLKLFGPGRDSGTFDYFTLAIVGTESAGREDYTKSEDDMVIEQGVAADAHAVGYFGYAYYQANKTHLKAVAVDNGRGCISPSPQTVADASYQPLSRPLFLYVNTQAAARPEVNAFIHFYLAPASAHYVTEIGYVPLTAGSLVAQAARFEKGVTGSAMGGRGSVTGVGLYSFDDKEQERVRNQLVQ